MLLSGVVIAGAGGPVLLSYLRSIEVTKAINSLVAKVDPTTYDKPKPEEEGGGGREERKKERQNEKKTQLKYKHKGSWSNGCG